MPNTTPTCSVENNQAIGKLARADVDALAYVVMRNNLVATPEESAAFYATARGQTMQRILNEKRRERAGQEKL